MDHENALSIEERLPSLFQPDTLLPEQYLSGHRSKQLEPGKRLMLAVLEDAVLCFQGNLLAQDAKKKALFRDAEAWIMEQSRDWIFSFESVCESLGLDPGYLRAGLLRWKEKKMALARHCSRKRRKAA
ncbi:MAG TPA: hypothetical protein VNL14_08200 [Candidatus Acidoferrales bacterium]|nr:hypothetical protein [Candidatus Acidoferrales bacterium]